MVATGSRCGNRATVNSGVVAAQGIRRLASVHCSTSPAPRRVRRNSSCDSAIVVNMHWRPRLAVLPPVLSGWIQLSMKGYGDIHLDSGGQSITVAAALILNLANRPHYGTKAVANRRFYAAPSATSELTRFYFKNPSQI